MELMLIVVIIGILAAMAIYYVFSLKEKAHISMLKSDLTSAFKASLYYHNDNPDGLVTLEILHQYGYNQSRAVRLSVEDGSLKNLKITATHSGVFGTYVIKARGPIYKE